jgi:SAM-dependent methyltransferase
VKGESLDRMLELVRPQRGWRALDVATGGGHTALALAPRVAEVVATDITAEMLQAAEQFIRGRGIANVSFSEADAMELPFGDASFDLVTCRIAPHHFSDCARFAREAARVLRPGGVAAMVDNIVPENVEAAAFINEIEKLRDPSHHRAYSSREWIEFWTGAGLGVEHTETFRKALDFDRWAGRMGVGEPLRTRLSEMLRAAPGEAAEALALESVDERLRFHLSEVLIVARKGV